MNILLHFKKCKKPKENYTLWYNTIYINFFFKYSKQYSIRIEYTNVHNLKQNGVFWVEEGAKEEKD